MFPKQSVETLSYDPLTPETEGKETNPESSLQSFPVTTGLHRVREGNKKK